MSDVTIQLFDAVTVVARRHVGSYHEAGPVFAALWGDLGAAGLAHAVRGAYGLSWDDPDAVPVEELRFDCCVAIDGARPLAPTDRVETIPAGEYAVLRHIGPYETLEQSYRALLIEWEPPAGRELRHDVPCVEVYVNDPSTVPPEERITELRVQLS